MIARRAHLEMALRFVNRLQTDPSFEVIWITEEMHSAGMGRLGRRLDKTYSLCDAVSFVDMDSQDMNAALTTDHHFEQEGFTRLLK